MIMMGFGAFGKIPSIGDFFRLDPPAGFVRVWDEWLQGLLLTGQGAHGPYWDGYYMTAPIWRFTLSPGLAGPEKVMGVLMPSVDRVGAVSTDTDGGLANAGTGLAGSPL